MQQAAAIAAALVLTAAAPTQAQDAAGSSPDLSSPEWAPFRTFVVEAQQIALRNMSSLNCGEAPCASATEAEQSEPPLSEAQLFGIGMTGVQSAIAEHCGVDWRQRLFLPMMRDWRSREAVSPRQLALVAAVHGVIQGSTLASLREQGDCDESMRSELNPQASGSGTE